MTQRLVVIGGGAAGMSAASAARRVDPACDIVVLEATGHAAYGLCGIPYYLAGLVGRADELLSYPPAYFRERRRIDLRLHTRALALDPQRQVVHYRDTGGQARFRGDVVAAGLQAGFDLDDLLALDLSYAPPYAPVYEPLLLAAQAAATSTATVAV